MLAATARNSGSPPAAIPRSALIARAGLVRFTVDDVLAMVRQNPELRDYRARATRERHEAVTLVPPAGLLDVPAADLLP